MNTNSNENNSPASEFDFDSILLEFRDLKEERESEEPVFEPRLPIEDSSAPEDDVFSASIDTGRSNLDDDDFSAPFKELASALKGDEPAPSDDIAQYSFNPDEII